jgi:hypothetical protein
MRYGFEYPSIEESNNALVETGRKKVNIPFPSVKAKFESLQMIVPSVWKVDMYT